MDTPEVDGNERLRPPTPLFRRAAIEHARHSLHGSPILARPPSWILLGAVYGAIVATAVSFFAGVAISRPSGAAGTGAQMQSAAPPCREEAWP